VYVAVPIAHLGSYIELELSGPVTEIVLNACNLGDRWNLGTFPRVFDLRIGTTHRPSCSEEIEAHDYQQIS